MRINFPDSFLWGASISSYQCEGGNFNTDWCLWEKQKNLEQAGQACNHYRLFETDFGLAKQLNLNSLRTSIEWARVCPQEESFSAESLQYYHKVLDSLIKLNLKPLITLHHFTNPVWFVEKGGWSNHNNIDDFLFYLKKTVGSLKSKVDCWLIFNEPSVYAYNSYLSGIWPPGLRSFKQAKKVLNNITKAYLLGYQEIKRIYGAASRVKVTLSKNIRFFSPCPDSNLVLNNVSAFFRSSLFNFPIIDHLSRRHSLDFLAVNYYCKEYSRFKGFIGEQCPHTHHKEHRNYLGWYVYPQGFYELLFKLKKFRLPVIVTENGTPETEDRFYEQYLISHIKSLARAFNQGVDIQGYFWWSLVDNFEWDKGFSPRFGLIEVDYTNFARKIRPFAANYARIIKDNATDI